MTNRDLEEDADENFDQPTKGKAAKKDAFANEENDADSRQEADDNVEVVVEGETKEAAERTERKPRTRSTEGRIGRSKSRREKVPSYVSDIMENMSTLAKSVETVAGRLKDVEANTNQVTDATIDQNIAEAERYYQQARSAHSAAVKEGDGDRATEAADVMAEARETLNHLRQSKAAGANRNVNRQPAAENNGQKPPRVDAKVMKMFGRWNADNDWFDPALKDRNSLIAFRIDNTLTAEGFDPRTEEYWEELDSRLRENPTLQNAGIFEEPIDDENNEQDDERPQSRVSAREAAETRRPNPQTSRSSQNVPNGKKKIIVTKQRADAMREMGLQPGTKEWNNMAKKFSSWDKNNQGAA